MIDRLLELVDDFAPGKQIYPIVMQLNRLVGLLRVHLAYEDFGMYHRLIASGDPRIARMAQSYVDEMGGLAVDLEQFAKYWSCSASIAGAFTEFRECVHAMMLALAVRIERENQHLYPVVEGRPFPRRDAAQGDITTHRAEESVRPRLCQSGTNLPIG